ncbi:hypothetical protein BH10PSE17_BH10PSE17_11230 [soil metagenome]
MRVTRALLDEAVAEQVLPAPQADALFGWLEARAADTPSFKPAHILYYVGGLIAIGAMTLFMTLGWEQFGGAGLMWISACYCLLAIALTEWFLRRKGLAIPAGITGALAVVMVPLAVYGLQHVLGFWADREGVDRSYRDFHVWIDWRWVVMEFATLIAGAIALWRYRLPFMVMPVAVTLWYMSMDLVPFLLGGSSADIFSDQGKTISMVFGLAMTAFAVVVDLRTGRTRDFAFWLYLFGVLAFWGGLSSLNSDSELNKFIYCLINLAMIAVGAAISRRVFAVFGGLGVAAYLGHLSYTVFKDSLWFPVALTAIGFAVIAAGVAWQRREAAIGNALRSHLPVRWREAFADR